MNYAEIKKYDIANGPGVCTSIFFSGCRHNCKGCFNEVAQDFNYGQPFTAQVAEKFIAYASDPNVEGVCILGGEPFQQDSSILLKLVYDIKRITNKPIWVWTGYTFEQLTKDPDKMLILRYIDVLIDGPFILSKRDLNLKYKGSSNQRVIDVPATLKNKKVITLLNNY